MYMSNFTLFGFFEKFLNKLQKNLQNIKLVYFTIIHNICTMSDALFCLSEFYLYTYLTLFWHILTYEIRYI